MSTGTKKRTRSEHVASLELPPGLLGRTLARLRRGDVLLKLTLCALAALAMWAVTGAYAPPFPYRGGHTPARDIAARIDFEVLDPEATKAKQDLARRTARCVYVNDRKSLKQLRQGLKNSFEEIVGDEILEKLPNKKDDVAAVEATVERAFDDFDRDGLLEKVHDVDQGSQTDIEVHPLGDAADRHLVRVEDALIDEAGEKLRQRLQAAMETVVEDEALRTNVIDRVQEWVVPKLHPTLTLNDEATAAARQAAAAEVPAVMKSLDKGARLAEGGKPLDAKSSAFQLLRSEHEAFVARMDVWQRLYFSLADFGMYVALYTLCGLFVYYREPRLLQSLRHFTTLLVLAVATVALSWFAADPWRVELIPILLFGMTVTVAYRQDLAMLLTAVVSLVVVLSLGQGIALFVVLVASSCAAIQLMGRIRSRTRLIYVGLVTAVVAVLTTLGIGTLVGQPLLGTLFSDALWIAICTLLAAVLMTGLLPFIERLFDVQTELSLLELGDAAHPLLQELVRRAPGTYNHSINVASIAEAAAEAIGANGLLARVGAYFHDIGKVLKPQYFVENQGENASRHESLLPAMSTLVIIAHVKDGADLARQHGLPNSLIDFIQQHHGTTLVEYFYDQASKQKKEDPDAGDVDEANFRYPGPKPQTPEAGVMMLADAVESASRTLVDPAPARIEAVVHDIAMNRLRDGQFDECSLTLAQLHTVEESLVKSLTAVYHGRIKYPDQQETA